MFAELKTKADLSTYGDVFVFRYVPVSTIESCARYFSHSDERVGDSTGLVFIICIITHPPPGHYHLHAVCSKKSTENLICAPRVDALIVIGPHRFCNHDPEPHQGAADHARTSACWRSDRNSHQGHR